ncbi:MAG: CynX/NimT family MFS transporter [Candidatus Velthaea sp.]
MIAALHLGKVPPAIPLLRAELHASALTAGWLLAIFSAIGAAAGIAFGTFADRVGRRRAVVGGLAVLALASVAGAFAPNAATLLALRAVEGFGFVAAVVAVPSLIVDAAVRQRERRLALGLWSAYVPVGSAIALFAAPLALAGGGWRALWLAAGIVTCAAAAIVAVVVRRAPVPTPKKATTLLQDARAVASSRLPLLLAGAFVGYAAEYLSFVGFLPAMLVDGGIPVARASLATACVVLANGAGNVAGGVLAQWTSRAAIIVTGALAFGAGALVLHAPALPLGVRYGFAVAASCAGGAVPAAIFACVPQFAPSQRLVATTQGLVVQGSSIGQLAGPVIVALAGGAQGTPASGLVMAAYACIAAACGLLLRAGERDA